MLQAVARPGSLAEAHAVLASSDRAAIIAGGTVGDAGAELRHRRVRHAGQPARQRPVRASAIDGGTATIGATTTLSELEDSDDARLPVAGARRDRFADHPQHGDRRRQSVRQAALWRFRRLPDRARRDGDDFAGPRGNAHRAGRNDSSPRRSGAARSSPASPSRCPRPARSSSARRRARRSIPRRSSPSRRSSRSSGGKVAECRIALGGVAQVGGPRAVGREGADRQAARPRERRGGGEASRARHRPVRRCLCQRLVPRARDAGAYPPRPARRVAAKTAEPPGRQP